MGENNVTKIYVPGSTSIKTPAAVRVFNRDVLKLTFEKLSWRGVPLQSQVLSTQLFVQSETEKSIVWTTNSATTPPVSASTLSLASRSGSNPKAPASGSSQHSRKETYRVDKLMMLRNPSFAYVMDQIEHQSRLSHSKYIQSHDSANSSSSNSKNE
ncbi:hypothetical protein EDD11_008103 [Mortierella claussenii]|nr:hypothetical protein EDD11_008103 [Mortierella claussenii]